MRDAEYFAIKDRAARSLMRIPNVTGVGIGGRERNGVPTGEIVIKVFVARKLPIDQVPAEERIPVSFEGVPTDVVELRPPVPVADPEPVGIVRPHLAQSADERTFPLQGGMDFWVNFDFPPGTAAGGTLGCFLRDRHDGSAIYGLTNHHVVTPDFGKLSRSRPVLQKQEGAPTSGDHFGTVTQGANDRYRDAAVVRLRPGQKWLPRIKTIGYVTGTRELSVEQAATGTYRVRKWGSRTSLTFGVVSAIGTRTKGRANDIVIKPLDAPPLPPVIPVFFAYLGDSGSVVVNDDNEIISLLHSIENIDPTDPNVDHRLVLAFTTPIKTVLELFSKKERLDLEVAVGGPTPTEATETRTVPPPAGAPVMTPAQVAARGDDSYRRPLTGGLQILSTPMLGQNQSTTLGCIVRDLNSPNGAYVLTSYAGVSANGTRPPTGHTEIGQPDYETKSSGCCRNTIAKFATGGPDVNVPTAALVRLDEDQPWFAEVLEIGAIEDQSSPSRPDVESGEYQVRKYGAGTRLTGGTIIAYSDMAGTLPPGVRPDAMLIRPNPNPARPTDDVCFSHYIDRGALIMNDDNHAVGLLYDEIDIPEPGGRHVIHGVATPIDKVMSGLNALQGVDVTLPTTKKIDELRTVHWNEVAEEATHSSVLPRVGATGSHLRLEDLRDRLSGSPGGSQVVALWNQHRNEVRDLIAHNRRVATVWHRSGGPALLQALSRSGDRDPVIPPRLNDVPTATCLERIAQIFDRYGGDALRADLARLRPLLPQAGGAPLDDLLTAIEGI